MIVFVICGIFLEDYYQSLLFVKWIGRKFDNKLHSEKFMWKCCWTWVRLPPPPPINDFSPFLKSLFLVLPPYLFLEFFG